MRRVARLSSHVAAALTGVLIGGILGLTLDAATRPDDPTDRNTPAETEFDVKRVPDEEPAGDVLFAWSPAGLPARTEGVLEAIGGVKQVTTVEAGLDWIASTRSGTGAVVDEPADGMRIPFEVAVVDPSEFAGFVSPAERDRILSLGNGTALLPETSARLRRGGEGMRIRLSDGRTLRVAGVVDDATASGYEAITAGPRPASWARVERFVIIRLADASSRRRVERTIGRLVPAGGRARVRLQGETPFMRYGDAVMPQMTIKDAFGEFAARPRPDGSLEIEDRWRRQNIVSARMPLLGRAACHRALFPQVRAALASIAAAGLGYAIDRSQFGGCYSARFIGRDPAGRISHHAWGIAVDVNVAENAPGTRADQDERIVRIFEEHGFTWGGRWLVPDGMHFEWVRFP